MRFVIVILCLTLLAPIATHAQLVVWDRSHNTQIYDIYGDTRAQLEAWGYTVEIRTTPLTENDDADIIVLLTEDGYSDDGTDFTAQEATWLKAFVDDGKGLLISNCLSYNYWQRIEAIMAIFGISNGTETFNPMIYDTFEIHPIFDGVTQLGDDWGPNGALTAAPPSTAVAWNGTSEIMALYESGDGTALWTSHYHLFADEGLDDYDNLVFLENAFERLSRGYVANENSSWGRLKVLYR